MSEKKEIMVVMEPTRLTKKEYETMTDSTYVVEHVKKHYNEMDLSIRLSGFFSLNYDQCQRVLSEPSLKEEVLKKDLQRITHVDELYILHGFHDPIVKRPYYMARAWNKIIRFGFRKDCACEKCTDILSFCTSCLFNPDNKIRGVT